MTRKTLVDRIDELIRNPERSISQKDREQTIEEAIRERQMRLKPEAFSSRKVTVK